MLIFDCETNGLLHEMDRVHCLVIKDTVTGECARYNDQQNGQRPIAEGVKRLQDATYAGVHIVGHNVVKFDVPALKLVYPWFSVVERFVLDTLVIARLTYPDMWDIDAKLKKRPQGFPGQLTNRHSLEAWGHRLGNFKGDYTGGWGAWSQEMEDYNVQDVEVTHDLYTFLRVKCKVPAPDVAVDLEMAVSWIIARQERYGFYFDQERAAKLYVKLSKRRLELEKTLKDRFAPFYVPDGRPLVPKRDNKKMGYVAGAQLSKVKLVEFNPASTDHIENRLKRLYGWKPTQFTEGGKAQLDEGVVKSLPYAEAPALAEYFLVQKRIGQLAEGKEACLRHVGKDSRIHGGVNTMGTVTGRMSHSHPNVAQTPAGYSPYGEEFRACYRATPGKDKVLVGADAAALEARCLAHYMALYDAGAYVQTVIAGRKEDGTDLHSVTMRAIEITSRDDAKTWYYAFLYGAGDEKLGFTILKVRAPAKCRKRGKQSRDSIARNLPALGKLIDAVKDKAKTGYLRGIDGRWLLVRTQHGALNTLLQACGAILMKRALVILDTTLQQEGYVPGVHYEFVANVHDEWQIECDAGLGVRVSELAVAAIRAAGESFSFRCPLDGEASTGASWADTH